eukprot:COSAG01_NODE_9669_length_2374_cov_3.652747_1_plen_180_part_10
MVVSSRHLHIYLLSPAQGSLAPRNQQGVSGPYVHTGAWVVPKLLVFAEVHPTDLEATRLAEDRVVVDVPVILRQVTIRGVALTKYAVVTGEHIVEPHVFPTILLVVAVAHVGQHVVAISHVMSSKITLEPVFTVGKKVTVHVHVSTAIISVDRSKRKVIRQNKVLTNRPFSGDNRGFAWC